MIFILKRAGPISRQPRANVALSGNGGMMAPISQQSPVNMMMQSQMAGAVNSNALTPPNRAPISQSTPVSQHLVCL
mgnify:CR=1 FL=1